MAKSKTNSPVIQSKPKLTSIGRSRNTKLSATSRNGRKKKYRRQGK